MRYKVAGRIIRAENAAKPVAQQSAFLLKFLSSLKRVERSYDYGCGKLRYVKEQLKKTDELLIVDSEIQLHREQKLHGRKTSIANFCRRYNRLSIASIRDLQFLGGHFDRGFCINVLSAVPIEAVRREILRRCYALLRPGGELIVTHQYRNSDFTRMKRMKNAFIFRDGYIVDSLRGASFYSTFSIEYLEALILESKLIISDTAKYDGTIILKCVSPELRTNKR